MRWTWLAAVLLSGCTTAQVAVVDAPAEEDVQLCAERDHILRQLRAKYEEAPVAIGLTSAGGIIELLTSDQGRTWTLIVTRPSGLACLFAAGEGWEKVERAPTEIGL